MKSAVSRLGICFILSLLGSIVVLIVIPNENHSINCSESGSLPISDRTLQPTISTPSDLNQSNTLEVKNVLLLSSWAEHLPWSQGFLRGVQQALMIQSNSSVNLFAEHIDYSRLKEPMSNEELAGLLNRKYQQIGIDAVIADAKPAIDFVFQYGQEVFGDNTAYVLVPATEIDGSILSCHAVITIEQTVQKTISLAIQQNPNTENIVLITDSSSEPQALLQESLRAIEATIPDAEVLIKTDFTVEELEQAVSTLSDDSVIIFTLVFQDRQGQNWRPVDVVERLAASASVPIYVFYDSLIGNGAVGGHVQSSEQIGETAVQAIYDLARENEHNQTIHLEYEVARTILDWRALQKWDIPPSLVPKDAEIWYRKPFVWEAYFKETLLAIIIMAIQSISVVVITVLYLQRKRLSKELLTLTKQLEERVAQRTEVLYRIATHDDLTGIYNRKEFYRLAHGEFERFQRYGHPFVFALLDIDKFKSINDLYGHPAGDKVIQDFAQVIAKTIRKQDIWGRVGGEEFALLLPETILSEGVVVLEKIRQSIQDFPFCLPDGQVIAVTVSIGAVESQVQEEGFEYLLNEADRRLYQGKEGGRNQVCCQEKE